MRLTKDEMLHERDEQGNLIPIEKELELMREYKRDENGKKKLVKEGPTVLITPMPDGELKRVMRKAQLRAKTDKIETTEDEDIEIIKKHLVEPKLTEEDLRYAKAKYVTPIVIAIFSISTGVSDEMLCKDGKKNLKKIQETSDEIKKKSNQSDSMTFSSTTEDTPTSTSTP